MPSDERATHLEGGVKGTEVQISYPHISVAVTKVSIWVECKLIFIRTFCSIFFSL